MRDAFFGRVYPFRMAVEVADVEAKSMRNWMDRGQLSFMDEVDAERKGESWRMFSVFDMMRLTITKNLVDFGVPVKGASLWAMGVFQGDAKPHYLAKLTKNDLVKLLSNRTIYIWRYGEGWNGMYVKKAPPSAPPAFLTVDVSTLVHDVFDRLDEMSDIS